MKKLLIIAGVTFMLSGQTMWAQCGGCPLSGGGGGSSKGTGTVSKQGVDSKNKNKNKKEKAEEIK